MKKTVVIFLSLIIFETALARPWRINFRQVKKVLLQKVYTPEFHKTFYCDCDFNYNKKIDPRRCGYKIKHDRVRGQRIEWEHIVPVSAFGRPLNCWKNARQVCGRKGGRKCCGKTNRAFQTLEADMNNLVPSIGELNADRSSYHFGNIRGEPRQYGNCNFEFNGLVVEPPSESKGDVARAYFYMNDRVKALLGYEIMSREEQKMFQKWDWNDPPDYWECKKQARIEKLQGTINQYVKKRCPKIRPF